MDSLYQHFPGQVLPVFPSGAQVKPTRGSWSNHIQPSRRVLVRFSSKQVGQNPNIRRSERSVPVFRVTSRLLVCYRYPCSTVRSLNLWFSLWSDGLGERCAIHPPHPSHPSPVRRRLASDERGPFSIRGGAAASMGGEPLPFEPGRFGGVGVGWGDGEIRVEV